MASSYALYVFVLLLTFLLSYYADIANSKTAKWCVIIMLTLLAGLRGPSVGLDTDMYMSKFLHIRNGRLDLAYGFEETFKYICFILVKVFRSPTVLLTIFALITHGCIINRFWDFRKIASFPVMVCCYYMAFFFISMNILRQFCAIAIVFLATRYLCRHKYFRYLLAVMIGFLFHKSAIIGLVLLATELIQWKNLSNKQKGLFIGIALLSPAIAYYILTQLLRYDRYFSRIHIDIGSMNIVKIMFFAVTAIFVFGIYKKENYIARWNHIDDCENTSISLPCVVYPLGLCLVSLGYIFRFADRIGWYFLIFECVYYGMLMKTNSRLNKLVFGAIILFLTGWTFVYGMMHNSQGTMPYAFFWQ